MCSFVRKGNNGKINLKTGKIFLCLSIPDFLFPERERESDLERRRRRSEREENEESEESLVFLQIIYKNLGTVDCSEAVAYSNLWNSSL